MFHHYFPDRKHGQRWTSRHGQAPGSQCVAQWMKCKCGCVLKYCTRSSLWNFAEGYVHLWSVLSQPYVPVLSCSLLDQAFLDLPFHHILGFTDFLEAPCLELESAVEMQPAAKGKAKAKAKGQARKTIKDKEEDLLKKARHKKCEQDVNRIAALRSRRTTVKNLVGLSVGYLWVSFSDFEFWTSSDLICQLLLDAFSGCLHLLGHGRCFQDGCCWRGFSQYACSFWGRPEGVSSLEGSGASCCYQSMTPVAKCSIAVGLLPFFCQFHCWTVSLFLWGTKNWCSSSCIVWRWTILKKFVAKCSILQLMRVRRMRKRLQRWLLLLWGSSWRMCRERSWRLALAVFSWNSRLGGQGRARRCSL